MNKEIYSEHVKSMAQDKTTRKMCFNCGEDNPLIMRKSEKHHILGKANSDETILLCPNCHSKITADQNKLKPEKRSSGASNQNRFRFRLVSRGSLLKLIGEQLISEGKNGKTGN